MGQRAAPLISPEQLRNEFDRHAERLVDSPRPPVAGDERPTVLPSGRGDERVVDGTP